MEVAGTAFETTKRVRVFPRGVVVIHRHLFSVPCNHVRVAMAFIEIGITQFLTVLATAAEYAEAVEGVANQEGMSGAGAGVGLASA